MLSYIRQGITESTGSTTIQEQKQRFQYCIDKLISTAFHAVTDGQLGSARPAQSLSFARVVLVVGPCTLCSDNGTSCRQSSDGTVSLDQAFRSEVVTIGLLETSVSL
jgi:hypothetical protein